MIYLRAFMAKNNFKKISEQTNIKKVLIGLEIIFIRFLMFLK